ncbi:tyrosine--tRNA ligase [Oceanimonas doudoroffii]|uniref:Tyrosine--tRNA ligase n=1 Tax=Oceanimonas doudoroffii TaxID=84158 RepID=A0A233REM7_9GAMM|nr:tyrosine--tRNA ligase [Oceanimonas doudoroffii]OXY81817.1 tyrosine--tRNA ligase [Oceanimonas doudoroffii]
MSHSLSLLDDLHRRGLIAQSSDAAALAAHLEQGSRTLYCGFDPTAGSLHIGHLVPLLMLRRFSLAGHRVVALVGGATGMIGDPSFKAGERSLNEAGTVQTWSNELSAQIRRLLNTGHDAVNEANVRLVNNAEWMHGMEVLPFLRDIGKHFSVNAMIARESVRQRLARPEQGISFTEFSYSLLQSYDYVMLNQQYDCTLQIGGNDQWGNITSGIDLTRRLNGRQVFGLTLPLITKADGTKFGKTESGTVWLDAARTSPYAFYQFWLNTSDDDVYRLLRYYSFIELEDIAALEASDRQRAGKPEAQRVLARELTRLVHGEQALAAAERISQALFSGEFNGLSVEEFAQLEQDGIPMTRIEATAATEPPSLSGLLKQAGLASSLRQARELIGSGAIAVNGAPVSADTLTLPRLHRRYLILRRGKKQFHLLRFEDELVRDGA